MNNYIPLYSCSMGEIFSEMYGFWRFSGDECLSLKFSFEDGVLCNKDASSVPEVFLPIADKTEAKKIMEGMTFEQVTSLLGAGFKASETKSVYSSSPNEETYRWMLDSVYNCVFVVFADGKVCHYFVPD